MDTPANLGTNLKPGDYAIRYRGFAKDSSDAQIVQIKRRHPGSIGGRPNYHVEPEVDPFVNRRDLLLLRGDSFASHFADFLEYLSRDQAFVNEARRRAMPTQVRLTDRDGAIAILTPPAAGIQWLATVGELQVTVAERIPAAALKALAKLLRERL